MKLSELVAGLEFQGDYIDREVTCVTSDSRKVAPGCVFVCIKGANFDGHTAAQSALDKGAAAVVCDHHAADGNELLVKNTRAANAVLCQNFFGNPQKQLKVVAVTGTNGKTTVTTVIKRCLENLGYHAGLIGTVCTEIDDIVLPSKYTTPEPWDLYSLMSRMVRTGCTHVVMEASSQALHQCRLANLHIDVAVFLNLSQDHLDYHGTMEEYFKAKKILFSQAETAVINIDDEKGKELAEELKIPTITFSSRSNDADYTAKSIDLRSDGIRYVVSGYDYIDRISFSMPGRYSVENSMAALCALFSLGIDRDKACGSLCEFKGVRGRCEVLHSGDYTVITDFAHTADALQNFLSSVKPFARGKVITLFGCAGDRDAGKRPAMAEAVCSYSDLIVFTADNPRTEDPERTAESVRPVLESSKKTYKIIMNRHKAVLAALDMMAPGDMLLLCGKGHEDYQVLDGVTVYLDEGRIVRDYFAGKGV